MNCEREYEVLDAVMSGRWPEGCDAEVRAHVGACTPCAELVLVAGAIREDHREALREAEVPPSAVVWWRAQHRARREALQAASRAITAVQTGAVAAAMVVGAALIGGGGAWLAHISDGIHFGGLPNPELLLLAAATTCVLFAPVTVWVLVTRD